MSASARDTNSAYRYAIGILYSLHQLERFCRLVPSNSAARDRLPPDNFNAFSMKCRVTWACTSLRLKSGPSARSSSDRSSKLVRGEADFQIDRTDLRDARERYRAADLAVRALELSIEALAFEEERALSRAKGVRHWARDLIKENEKEGAKPTDHKAEPMVRARLAEAEAYIDAVTKNIASLTDMDRLTRLLNEARQHRDNVAHECMTMARADLPEKYALAAGLILAEPALGDWPRKMAAQQSPAIVIDKVPRVPPPNAVGSEGGNGPDCKQRTRPKSLHLDDGPVGERHQLVAASASVDLNALCDRIYECRHRILRSDGPTRLAVAGLSPVEQTALENCAEPRIAGRLAAIAGFQDREINRVALNLVRIDPTSPLAPDTIAAARERAVVPVKLLEAWVHHVDEEALTAARQRVAEGAASQAEASGHRQTPQVSQDSLAATGAEPISTLQLGDTRSQIGSDLASPASLSQTSLDSLGEPASTSSAGYSVRQLEPDPAALDNQNNTASPADIAAGAVNEPLPVSTSAGRPALGAAAAVNDDGRGERKVVPLSQEMLDKPAALPRRSNRGVLTGALRRFGAWDEARRARAADAEAARAATARQHEASAAAQKEEAARVACDTEYEQQQQEILRARAQWVRGQVSRLFAVSSTYYTTVSDLGVVVLNANKLAAEDKFLASDENHGMIVDLVEERRRLENGWAARSVLATPAPQKVRVVEQMRSTPRPSIAAEFVQPPAQSDTEKQRYLQEEPTAKQEADSELTAEALAAFDAQVRSQMHRGM